MWSLHARRGGENELTRQWRADRRKKRFVFVSARVSARMGLLRGSHGGQGHTVGGAEAQRASRKWQGRPWAARCLPFLSVCTLCVRRVRDTCSAVTRALPHGSSVLGPTIGSHTLLGGDGSPASPGFSASLSRLWRSGASTQQIALCSLLGKTPSGHKY